MIGIWNLWLFFVLGYSIVWASMIWANRKRGKPIEDPEFYQMTGGKKCMAIGWTWLVVLLLICLFTPVNFGILFWIGLPLFIMGIVLNAIAMYSRGISIFRKPVFARIASTVLVIDLFNDSVLGVVY